MHAQAPARRGRDLAHLIDNLVGAADELGAIAQEGEAELRELDAARVAVKERRADEAFKLLDARRDDRAREPHLARRLGEAARLGDAHEGIDRGKAVHARGILRLAAQGAAPSGTRLPSSVGISSLTVGWMCTARSMILYEASAAMTSTSEWTISSPSMQRSAAPRMRSLSASSSATGSDPRSTVRRRGLSSPSPLSCRLAPAPRCRHRSRRRGGRRGPYGRWRSASWSESVSYTHLR